MIEVESNALVVLDALRRGGTCTAGEIAGRTGLELTEVVNALIDLCDAELVLVSADMWRGKGEPEIVFEART